MLMKGVGFIVAFGAVLLLGSWFKETFGVSDIAVVLVVGLIMAALFETRLEGMQAEIENLRRRLDERPEPSYVYSAPDEVDLDWQDQ